MKYFSRIFTIASCFGLAACGFSPVYSEFSGARAAHHLENIQIDPTRTRTTQLVRNQLIRQFSNQGPNQQPLYRLALHVSSSNSSTLIRRSTDIQRSNLTLRASYTLFSNDRKTVLTSGRSVSIAAYNIVSEDFGTITGSEFANVSAKKDARKKAAVSVADDIARRLAAYFASRPPAG